MNISLKIKLKLSKWIEKENSMQLLMKTKTALRKSQKDYQKLWQANENKNISNYRLVDLKIVNEFKRKSQIKKKSSHIKF